MAELEHLRDEAKVAMEEFLEGVISKENLNNRSEQQTRQRRRVPNLFPFSKS